MLLFRGLTDVFDVRPADHTELRKRKICFLSKFLLFKNEGVSVLNDCMQGSSLPIPTMKKRVRSENRADGK